MVSWTFRSNTFHCTLSVTSRKNTCYQTLIQLLFIVSTINRGTDLLHLFEIYTFILTSERLPILNYHAFYALNEFRPEVFRTHRGMILRLISDHHSTFSFYCAIIPAYIRTDTLAHIYSPTYIGRGPWRQKHGHVVERMIYIDLVQICTYGLTLQVCVNSIFHRLCDSGSVRYGPRLDELTLYLWARIFAWMFWFSLFFCAFFI